MKPDDHLYPAPLTAMHAAQSAYHRTRSGWTRAELEAAVGDRGLPLTTSAVSILPDDEPFGS